ncbi:MAG: hypothetical protein ACUVX8_18275 [Candidatus Zipacnadales bacterium]
MSRTHTWQFPLPRTHTGILQGNGTMGAMIWGSDNVLKIAIGRADFKVGGIFHLANPWSSNGWVARASGAREMIGGAVLAVLTSPGEVVTLGPEI